MIIDSTATAHEYIDSWVRARNPETSREANARRFRRTAEDQRRCARLSGPGPIADGHLRAAEVLDKAAARLELDISLENL